MSYAASDLASGFFVRRAVLVRASRTVLPPISATILAGNRGSPGTPATTGTEPAAHATNLIVPTARNHRLTIG